MRTAYFAKVSASNWPKHCQPQRHPHHAGGQSCAARHLQETTCRLVLSRLSIFTSTCLCIFLTLMSLIHVHVSTCIFQPSCCSIILRTWSKFHLRLWNMETVMGQASWFHIRFWLQVKSFQTRARYEIFHQLPICWIKGILGSEFPYLSRWGDINIIIPWWLWCDMTPGCQSKNGWWKASHETWTMLFTALHTSLYKIKLSWHKRNCSKEKIEKDEKLTFKKCENFVCFAPPRKSSKAEICSTAVA